MVKQENPIGWQEFIDRIGQRWVASDGKISPEDALQNLSDVKGLLHEFWRTMSMANDVTIIALGRAEITTDETLQRQDETMCANRAGTDFDLSKLPPESLRSVQEFMKLETMAYREGKGRAINLIDDDTAEILLGKAVNIDDAHQISKGDLDILFSRAPADPARKCRIRLQFDRNVSSFSQSVPLLRWLYANQ